MQRSDARPGQGNREKSGSSHRRQSGHSDQAACRYKAEIPHNTFSPLLCTTCGNLWCVWDAVSVILDWVNARVVAESQLKEDIKRPGSLLNNRKAGGAIAEDWPSGNLLKDAHRTQQILAKLGFRSVHTPVRVHTHGKRFRVPLCGCPGPVLDAVLQRYRE